MKDDRRAPGPRTEQHEPMLPDEGAMVDEHGRPPGTRSRTGTGSDAPPADPVRVERAAKEDEPDAAGRCRRDT